MLRTGSLDHELLQITARCVAAATPIMNRRWGEQPAPARLANPRLRHCDQPPSALRRNALLVTMHLNYLVTLWL